MIDFVQTPDERFDAIPNYPFDPRYLEWQGLRIHYIDQGHGRPVVLFHGEPTWSFLYRKIVPPLAAAGYRAIAVDYPGFGKSDKPTDPGLYTYDRHIEAMTATLESLDIAAATAVVQDWGGPIGLRLAVEHPEWFDRLSILNTGLFSGRDASEGFMAWRQFVEKNEDLPVGFIMDRSQVTELAPEVVAAYEAPYPDASYKVGAHRSPHGG